MGCDKPLSEDDQILTEEEATGRLQEHVDCAAQLVDELGESAFSEAQQEALASYPGLEDAYRGHAIDMAARAMVAADPLLEGFEGKCNDGPDFTSRSHPGVWWDMTTKEAFPEHEAKYPGRGIFLDTHRYKGVGSPEESQESPTP